MIPDIVFVICVIFGAIIGVAVFVSLMRRDDGGNCNAYLEWVDEIYENTPDFQPPYITNAEGRWIQNPNKPAHQTIKHRDGTVTHL